jgi:hypothetical protein
LLLSGDRLTEHFFLSDVDFSDAAHDGLSCRRCFVVALLFCVRLLVQGPFFARPQHGALQFLVHVDVRLCRGFIFLSHVWQGWMAGVCCSAETLLSFIKRQSKKGFHGFSLA